MINERHKFFLSSDFLPGAVIYEEQPYPGLELKYNVYEDQLLAKVATQGQETFLQLIKEKVDRFSMADKLFFNIKDSNAYQGFAELLFETDELLLLKKHSMSLSKKMDREYAYYEFTFKNPRYLFRWQENYFELSSRRSVINIFPQLKKEIRQFYSTEKALRKNNPDAFLQGLFEFISNNLTEIQASEV